MSATRRTSVTSASAVNVNALAQYSLSLYSGAASSGANAQENAYS